MTDTDTPRDFIRTRVTDDVERGHRGGQVATRFPPEPNGYLHIGHAKSICLNFGVAEEFDGTCNLRYDDTNPLTESPEYADSIARDIEWLGFSWDEKHYASDYFERLYELAEELTGKGLAYVDFSSEEKIRKMRGTVSEAGTPSEDRDRSTEENLALLRKMREGEMVDGEAVLRAKIDLAHPNMKMRDPLLYRIRHAHHYRTGEDWPIYPMYDWAHGLSDWIEGITHSLCTLEFENNRELYDWILHALELDDLPQQIEFARLNLSYTVLSKRKLLELVRDGHVDGWEDPRMPTLSGLRKRGVTPEAIRDLCERVGVAKANSVVDLAQLEHAIRNDLNYRAPRVLGVLRPLKVVIENWPEAQVDELDAPYWPHDIPKEGSRTIPFTREIYIERDDFHRDPPKKYRRLAPGREVRLRYGYLIRATDFVENDDGEVVEVRATYDPETRGGNAPDGRKVSGTIHWVSAQRSCRATVRLYDRLFRVPSPDRSDDGRPFTDFLNPESLDVIEDARLEPSLAEAEPGSRFQFERHGYFYLDPDDSRASATGAAGGQVWNQVVTLRDSWARITAAQAEAAVDAPAEAREKASQKLVEMPTKVKPFDPDTDLDGSERPRYDRYLDAGLASDDARVLAQADDADRLQGFFTAAVAAGGAPESVANWLVNDLLRELKTRGWDDLALTPEALAELSTLADDDQISSATAGELFEELVADGGSPRKMVEERGLQQVSDEGELATAVAAALAAHPDEAERFRGGETKLTGFFVGQVMRETGGTADPQKVRELLGREASG